MEFSGNPLAVIGKLASAQVDVSGSLGQAISRMGEGVLHSLQGAAKGAVAMLTQDQDLLLDSMLQYTAGFAQFYSAGILHTTAAWEDKPMAQAHTPPRPRASLEASGCLSVDGRAQHNANLEARVGVRHGGYCGSAHVSWNGAKSFDHLRFEGRADVTMAQRAQMAASFESSQKFTVGGGSARAQLGFDLAGRCADMPTLSAAMCSMPRASQSGAFGGLMASRAECHGGGFHFRAAIEADFGSMTAHTVKVRPPQGRPDVPVKEAPKGPKESKDPKGSPLENPGSFLNDPSLSFENKIMLFMLAMAKRQEDKIEGMMGQFEANRAASEGCQGQGQEGRRRGWRCGRRRGGRGGQSDGRHHGWNGRW